MIDAGQKGGERAQQRDEPAEEHNLAAVFQEQILTEFKPALVEFHVPPKAIEERKAELPPHPVTAIVAEDRAASSRCDHAVDVELALPCENRGGH